MEHTKIERQASEEMPYRQNFDDDEGFEEDPNAFLDEPTEEQKEEKLVVRLVPVAIDWTIFGIQLAILGLFFYAAYFHDDGNKQCWADRGSDKPLPLQPDDPNQKYDLKIIGVNVTKYFKIAICWGFWMSLLTFIRAILAQVGLYLKRWVLLWCSYVLFATNISISIVLFILMQIWRWSHGGRVCSGDYLSEDEVFDENDYLIFEGKFIRGVLILIYSILGLSCLSIFLITVCFYRRHRTEQEPSGDVNTSLVSERTRQSAFTKALDPDYEAAMRDTQHSIYRKGKQFGEANKTDTPVDQEKLL